MEWDGIAQIPQNLISRSYVQVGSGRQFYFVCNRVENLYFQQLLNSCINTCHKHGSVFLQILS